MLEPIVLFNARREANVPLSLQENELYWLDNGQHLSHILSLSISLFVWLSVCLYVYVSFFAPSILVSE